MSIPELKHEHLKTNMVHNLRANLIFPCYEFALKLLLVSQRMRGKAYMTILFFQKTD